MNAVDSWTSDIWNKINGQPAQNGQAAQAGLLETVMGKIRIAQQAFPTTVQGDDKPIPADTIDLKTGVPSVGQTKPVVTISKSFQLADMHVKDLPQLTMAMNQVTLAGQSLALVEDTLFFQGEHALDLPTEVRVSKASDLQGGLLGLALQHHRPIIVEPSGGHHGRYGSATYAAVTKGISVFGRHQQGQPYALILDPATFADANLPLQDNSLITPACAIQALVGDGGQFLMSPGLPANTGLLASLGGQTTMLYIGTGPTVEFTQLDRNGIYYFFTACESIQFTNIDARSLLKLEFRGGGIEATTLVASK
jgi:uncharacterized linocin/CFP29 family protein